MKLGRFRIRLVYASSVGALALMGFWSSTVQAQHEQPHAQAPQAKEATADRKARESAFVKVVRDATERYRDVSVALADGYVLQFGCVSGSDWGAMGVHFVNGSLAADGVLDPTRPELLVYEPTRGGGFRLVAADYLVLSETWHANNPAPPELMGQLFHLFESPNRFGLPPFYTLHVWAWQENPNGTFVNWNPKVSCDAYNPQLP
jgi:hypothetical protein